MNVMLAWSLGGTEVVLILAVILILFGAKKIPELAKGMGQAANRQYQQEFLAAVRQQLFPAQQPQSSPDTDMGPLFQVLTIRP